MEFAGHRSEDLEHVSLTQLNLFQWEIGLIGQQWILLEWCESLSTMRTRTAETQGANEYTKRLTLLHMGFDAPESLKVFLVEDELESIQMPKGIDLGVLPDPFLASGSKKMLSKRLQTACARRDLMNEAALAEAARTEERQPEVSEEVKEPSLRDRTLHGLLIHHFRSGARFAFQ